MILLINGREEAVIYEEREIGERVSGSTYSRPEKNVPGLHGLQNGSEAGDTLECKKFAGASRQANQSDYVGMMDHMSFSRFIEPSNKEEVLRELQQAFKP